MFGPDPIDIFDPSPYGALAYYGHYFFGALALIASISAFAVRKGKGLHRTFGLVFIAATGTLCITSISMLADNFIPPLAIAVFTTVYAIGGAYLALQPGSRWVRSGEISLTALEIIGLAVFLSFSIPQVQAGNIPAAAPAIIAAIPLVLLAGDAYWHLNQTRRRQLRVARHLARMVWAFVVVLRAPLVEIVAGGLPLPAITVVIGPPLLAIAMLWYFQRKYGGSPFGKQP